MNSITENTAELSIETGRQRGAEMTEVGDDTNNTETSSTTAEAEDDEYDDLISFAPGGQRAIELDQRKTRTYGTPYAWDHAATPYRGSVVGITNETQWYGGAKYPEQHRLELQLVGPSGEVIDAVRKWYPAYADTRMMVLDAALSFDIPIWDQTWTMNDGRMFNTMIDASAPIRMRIELRSIDDLLGIKHFYLSTSTTATVTSTGRGIAGIYGPRDRMEDEEKEKKLHAQDRGYLLGLLEVVQGMARTRGKMRADEQGSTMPTGPC